MTPHTPVDARHANGASDLAYAAGVFADRLGWPVSVDAARQRLITRTGEVFDALIVPQDLAEPVAHGLRSTRLAGPVSRDEGGRWWTFYTELCDHVINLPSDLRAARVHAVPRGGQLVIPPISSGSLWWAPPRRGQALPPWSEVVAATGRIARCLSRRGTTRPPRA